MKKSNLFAGIAIAFMGALFSIIASFTETRLESLFWGFAGGGFGGGGSLLWKYFYWTRPNNKARYKDKV